MEREGQVTYGEPKRKLTEGQIALIRGYRIFARALTEDLTAQPELANELSTLVHDPTVAYRDILQHFLYESGRSLTVVMRSLFVRAMEVTPQCSDEERAFLSRVRREADTGNTQQEDTLTEFKQWVDTRMPFMVRGLQYFVRHSGIINRLSSEEARGKTVAGLDAWRAANTDQVTQIAKQASQAYAQNPQPRTFTLEVRRKIQGWFDRSLDYQTVAELLGGEGIVTGERNLIDAVRRHPDLHYTPGEVRAEQRQGYLKAVEQMFRLTGSRSATVAFFENLGYTRVQTGDALNSLKLRERVDWKSEVEVESRRITLEALMMDFRARESYFTVKEEYQAFVTYLQQLGINTKMTENAYQVRRQKTKLVPM